MFNFGKVPRRRSRKKSSSHCDTWGTRRLRGFEPLEERRLLSVIQWNGGPSGTGTNFEDPTNWVGGVLPGPSDDAVIGSAFSSQTVTSAANIAVNSLTSKAPLQISAGALTVTTTAEVDNTLTLSGGTANFNGTITLGSMNLSGGTLGGTGNVTFGGTVNWTGGTIAGTGTTDIAAGGTLNVSNTVYLQGVLENDGTANWTAGSYSAICMSNGTINNYGSWAANSSSSLDAYGMNSGSVNAFNNEASGTFTQEGTGTTEFTSDPSGMPFNNAGTVNVSAGTLQLTSGGSNSAAINVSAGAVANFSNSYTHAAGSSLNGAGTVQFSGGTQTIAGAVTMAGILDFTSGTIGGPGNLTATGTVNWTAGTIASTGRPMSPPAGR